MQRSMLSMFNKPFDLSSGLPSLESQSGLFDRSSFSTQPLNLSSFRKFAQLTVGMILSIHLTEEGRIDSAVWLRADMNSEQYALETERYYVSGVARREGAADVAEVGCTPEVTSPLTRARTCTRILHRQLHAATATAVSLRSTL